MTNLIEVFKIVACYPSRTKLYCILVCLFTLIIFILHLFLHNFFFIKDEANKLCCLQCLVAYFKWLASINNMYLHMYTYAVWTELEKENREFFEAYMRNREKQATEMEMMQWIQRILQETAARDPDNDED